MAKELEQVRQELGQRDAMVSDLMRQEGRDYQRLSLHKPVGQLLHSLVPVEQDLQDGNGTTASGVPLPPDVKRVEALVKNVDSMLGGEVKKRLPCAGYRILLPNLMGFRPERSTQWVLRVSRAIITAKMRDDALAA